MPRRKPWLLFYNLLRHCKRDTISCQVSSFLAHLEKGCWRFATFCETGKAFIKRQGHGAGQGIVRFWEGWAERWGRGRYISICIIASVFTMRKTHSVSPDRSIHVLTASMPNKRSFRSYSRHLLYQSCKGAAYSLFQMQASVCRTAV